MKGLPDKVSLGIVRFLSIALGLGALACHSAPRAQFPDAETALERLGKQTECSRAITGEADLVLSGTFFSMRGKMLYMAQAPDRLRFDLYSSFGVTLTTLTSDGKRFGLYSLKDKSFWYGPAKTCNLERFTRVRVPPFALVELLRGRAPVLAHGPEDVRIRFKRPWFSRGYYQIDIRGDHESEQRIRIAVVEEDWNKATSDQRLRLVSVRVKQGGRLAYKVKLSDHRGAVRATIELSDEEFEMGIAPRTPSGPVCSAEVPGVLRFEVPDTGYELKIENREVSHNPSFLSSAFTQPIPAGVASAYSNCSD